jgi:glycosyltransferase involved in cell wall biosynthesis
MTHHRPEEPAEISRVVANSLVVGVDEGARDANPFYWHRARPLATAVVDAIEAHGSDALRAAAKELLDDPGNPSSWAAVRDLVAAEVSRSPEGAEPICRAAWAVASRARLDHHVGPRYTPRPDATGVTVSALASPRVSSAGPDPRVLVVIPFRDRSEEGFRARNLLACLTALRDQSLPAEHYRVCVVESDREPRWRELVTGHADDYVFAPKSGPFNKCWAVNVGVLNAVGSADILCVLDADALPDRDFLRRNSDRFLRPGTGAFLPFRDLLYLDESATAHAVEQRCLAGRPEADRDELRGFLVHRAPGVCVWLRRDVFDSVNGMDERYEGWGREDMDFVLRLHLATSFVHFDDPMLHLHHPTSVHLVDGQTVNAHIPWFTWDPTEPIGRIDRFADV